VAAALCVTSRFWSRRRDWVAGGWASAALLPLAVLPFAGVLHNHPWHGTAVFGAGGLVHVWVALGSRGTLAAAAGFAGSRAVRLEQQSFARTGGWLLFAGAGYTSLALSLSPEAGGWVFAGIAAAAWLLCPAIRRAVPGTDEVLAPLGLTAIVVALAACGEAGNAALILAGAAVAASLAVGGRWATGWRAAYAAAGVFALYAAADAAVAFGRGAWELPAAAGAVFVAVLFDAAVRRFEPAWLAVPVLGSVAAGTVVYWQGWPAAHLAWTPLAFAAGIVLFPRCWEHARIFGVAGWAYALALALAPVVLVSAHLEHAWSGAVAFAVTAAVWARVALTAERPLGRALPGAGPAFARLEREALLSGAIGFLFAAAGYVHLESGLSIEHSAWTYAAAACVLLALAAVRPGRDLGALLGGAALGLGIAALAASGHHGQQAIISAAASAGFALVAFGRRQAAFTLPSALLGMGSLAFAWAWAEWPAWSLALVYAGTGSALTSATAPWQRAGGSRSLASVVLPGATWSTSLAVALGALASQAETHPGLRLAESAEWAAVAGVGGLAGLLLVAEGALRLGRGAWLPGSALLLAASEMAIAIGDPGNAQAYTAPIAVYLLGLGLAWRRSPGLIARHLFLHEAVLLAGAAMLLLPPAAMALGEAGAGWGLLVIAEGVALAAAGFALSQRWLVVAGVAGVGGAALRYFFLSGGEGGTPYWVWIGLAGILLLTAGVLMLLERDWWDRARGHLSHWWLEGGGRLGTTEN
jgi:hypothetical protein